MTSSALPRSNGAGSRRPRVAFFAAWRDRHVWRRTLALGLPVGLLQAALNQGDHWWHSQVDAAVVAKTILSPLLSCTIAFVSAAATCASRTLPPSSS